MILVAGADAHLMWARSIKLQVGSEMIMSGILAWRCQILKGIK